MWTYSNNNISWYPSIKSKSLLSMFYTEKGTETSYCYDDSLHWYMAIICNPGALLKSTSSSPDESAPIAHRKTAEELHRRLMASQIESEPAGHVLSSVDRSSADAALDEISSDPSQNNSQSVPQSSTGVQCDSDFMDIDDGARFSSIKRNESLDMKDDVVVLSDDDLEEIHPTQSSAKPRLVSKISSGPASPSVSSAQISIKPLITQQLQERSKREKTKEQQVKQKSLGKLKKVREPKGQKGVELYEKARSECYILFFDSLTGKRHTAAPNKLKEYLKVEAKEKRGVEAKGPMVAKSAKVPGQTNMFDCGVYLLHYCERFFDHPDLAFMDVLNGMNTKMIWKPEDLPSKREELAILMESFHEHYKKENSQDFLQMMEYHGSHSDIEEIS